MIRAGTLHAMTCDCADCRATAGPHAARAASTPMLTGVGATLAIATAASASGAGDWPAAAVAIALALPLAIATIRTGRGA